MKNKNKKTNRKAQTKAPKKTNYYQVIGANNRFNAGAFPPGKHGLEMARDWANALTKETGEKFVVKRR